MKKKREIGIQKSAIKKVAKSGSQEIEKQVIAKKERGITLIALVVTIIIMLILAGVALSMALGDNGLFQMAKFSRNKYEQAATNESTAMGEMEEVFPKTARELTKDNYGDYVDYGLDLNEDGDFTNDWRIFYVGDVPKNGEDGAEDGKTETRAFLIAADYVPNECDALQEAKTKEHANMTQSTSEGYKVCTSYWSSIPEYHCNDNHNKTLNNTKPQCSFPEVFMTTGNYCASDRHYYCSDHVGEGGNPNSKCASSLQCTGNWGSFVEKSGKGGCANYAIGGPTLEMWVASWNQKHGSDTEQEGKTGRTLYANGKVDTEGQTGYYVGTNADSKNTSCGLNDTEGYKDTLYFPHQAGTGLDLFDQTKSTEPVSEETSDLSNNASCDAYWLSSPSANGSNYLLEVSYLGLVYIDWYNHGDNGVRPVVSLKSNVKFAERDGTGERVVYDINT